MLLLGDVSFISDAGVAGDILPCNVCNMGFATAPWGSAWDEGRAERCFGTGGGGISDKVSGETEPFSESVRPTGDPLCPCGAGGGKRWCCESWLCCNDSASSLRACAFMLGVVWGFFFNGLEIGDCRTLPLPLTLEAVLFLGTAFFATSFDNEDGVTLVAVGVGRSISEAGELFLPELTLS